MTTYLKEMNEDWKLVRRVENSYCQYFTESMLKKIFADLIEIILLCIAKICQQRIDGSFSKRPKIL